MSEIQTLSTTIAETKDVETEAIQTFVEKVSQLPQVEAALKVGADEGIGIWTVIAERDLAVRERIYALQGEAIRQVPYPVFDFHVTTCEGDLLTEWMPTGAVILFRRGVKHLIVNHFEPLKRHIASLPAPLFKPPTFADLTRFVADRSRWGLVEMPYDECLPPVSKT